MNELNFSWKFKNFWITTNHEKWLDENRDYNRESSVNNNIPVEISKYNEDGNSRYVIAYFILTDEGYELQSCGGRLFTKVNSEEISEIWKQLQAVQKMLDAYFEVNH